MMTAQQRLVSFLEEKAEVYRAANTRLMPIYENYFGQPLLDDTRSFPLTEEVKEVIDQVMEVGPSVTVVTRQHFKDRDLGRRYHLAAVGEDWKIVRIDWECFLCRGTGQSRSGAVCHRCGGEGWFDPRKGKEPY